MTTPKYDYNNFLMVINQLSNVKSTDEILYHFIGTDTVPFCS